MCSVCAAAKKRIKDMEMNGNDAAVHKALDALTRQKWMKEGFRAHFGQELLEGLISKDFVTILPSGEVSIMIPGVKHLLFLEKVDAPT